METPKPKQDLYIRIRENATVNEAIEALKAFNERFDSDRSCHSAIANWCTQLTDRLELHADVFGDEFTEQTIQVWSCCYPQIRSIEAHGSKSWEVFQ